MNFSNLINFLSVDSLCELQKDVGDLMYCLTKINKEDLDPQVNLDEIIDQVQRFRNYIYSVDD